MTSQVNASITTESVHDLRDFRPPLNAPRDYCHKLKSGIKRLGASIRQQYEEAFPGGGVWISRAIRDAEEAAWATPFPSLFFPALAHLRVNEMMPLA
ncbi:MAG TPA: hypothetical protein VH207_12990 [Chthoniobacterales bacterium]|jgi:hypothetical protein|nr:hypothetical protein [Chthoniobacterales bacterium]